MIISKFYEEQLWGVKVENNIEEKIAIIHPSSMKINVGETFYDLDADTKLPVDKDICVDNTNDFITGTRLSGFINKSKFYNGLAIAGKVIYYARPLAIGDKVEIYTFGEIKEGTITEINDTFAHVNVGGSSFARLIKSQIKNDTLEPYFYIYTDRYTEFLLDIYNNLILRILTLTTFEVELLEKTRTLLNL
jgi:hypothetical protein